MGPASRVVSQSFLSGGSNKLKAGDIGATGTHSAIYGSQNQKSTSVGLHNKDRHLGFIQNTSVGSAAPPSHPPAIGSLLDPKADHGHMPANSRDNSTSHTGASSKNAATRSISRARQFGKDLTNMFSFTRQPSR